MTSVCLSADNRYAVSGSEDETLRLWEVSSGRCLRTFMHGDCVTSVCLSADGRYPLSGSWDKTLKLWEVSDDRVLWTLKGHGACVTSVCLSADGRYALSGSGDETLKLWDLFSGHCLRTFIEHKGGVTSVCLSADGGYALSGSDDKTLKLWEVSSGRCLRTFEGHESSVTSVCLSADNRYAVSGSEDETLRLWEVGNWIGHRAPWKLSEVSASEKAGAIESAFQEWLATANLALGKSNVLDTVKALRRAQALPGCQRRPEAIQAWHGLYVSLPRNALTGGWNERTFEERHASPEYSVWLGADGIGVEDNACWATAAERSPVYSVCLSVDARYALSGGENIENVGAFWNNKEGTLKLWEVSSGRCLRTFEEHRHGGDDVTSVCLSADGRYVLSGGGNISENLGAFWNNRGTLKLWEVSSGRCLRTFEGHAQLVSSVCLSGDGCWALSGSVDKTLKLWEVSSGRCLRTFKGHTSPVYSVCLSSDGRYALSGSWHRYDALSGGRVPYYGWVTEDKTLKFWETASGRCLRTFEGHTRSVISVCLSANGGYALSGSEDKTLKLWEIASGRCLRTFEGHSGRVLSVCLSVDSRYALSGSEDKTLKLWEVSSGRCLRTFEGHADLVESVCLSADGGYALSGSRDGTLKLWSLDWELENKQNVRLGRGSPAVFGGVPGPAKSIPSNFTNGS